jgi:hypothetical protein
LLIGIDVLIKAVVIHMKNDLNTCGPKGRWAGKVISGPQMKAIGLHYYFITV